ncbi:MAG: sulfite exporter TauE/SafE family protein [Actinomycetes bacterium]
MRKLVMFAFVGLAAQLVDGSLGMAYGVTSSTLLLAVGTAPAVASASVHLAEIGTSLASGVSHWRFGNVDWRVVGTMAVPGAIGAFAGATALSSLSTESAAPWMAAVLIALGTYIMVRFSGRAPKMRLHAPPKARFLAPLGLVAGFVDASGGGGWGPIGTSTLLSSGRLDPRKTIGSVSTSEFLVTVAASIGFLVGLGSSEIPFSVVGALLVGGVVAAPLGAWLVRHVPGRLLGIGAGGLIVFTNALTILDALEVSPVARVAVLAVVAVAWGALLAGGVARLRREKSAQTEEPLTATSV